MNKYLKLALSILFLLVSTNVFAQIDINNKDKNEIEKLAKELDQQISEKNGSSSLYSFVKQEFENYYGLKNFSDPNHQTGWFRVDDFLKWLRENEQILNKETVNIGDKKIEFKKVYENSNSAFWVYLGIRYITSKYNINTNLDKIHLFPQESSSCSYGEGNICISGESRKFVSIINTGIHEATHIFPYLKNGDDTQLSELATFYTIYNYGFPIKSKDASTFGDGVRDFRRTMELRPDLDMLFEYNYSLLGLLLNPQIQPTDIFSFTGQAKYNMDIGHFCFNLAALNNNNFFHILRVMGSITIDLAPDYFNDREIALLTENANQKIYFGEKIFSERKCKHLFATFADDNGMPHIEGFEGIEALNTKKYIDIMLGNNFKNLKNVKLFYNNLYKKLPKEFVEKYSVQVENKQKYWDGYKKIEPYKEDIKEAIFETLEEMNLPQVAIPEGYI